MPSAYKGVVVKGGTGSHYGLWTSPDNKWVFGAPSNMVGGSITTGWHHVVLWQDGSSRKLYVDGTVSGSGSAQAGDANGEFQIGRSGFKTGEYFNGKVDEVRVYNKALTVQEISLLMSASPVTGILIPRVNNLPVSVVPNPLRIPGRIDLSTGKVRVSHVTLHTIQGELVRVFDPEAGKSIVWDGTGNAGQQVKPGVYMIRIYTDQGMASRRIMVLH
jgi:hypothetical protein